MPHPDEQPLTENTLRMRWTEGSDGRPVAHWEHPSDEAVFTSQTGLEPGASSTPNHVRAEYAARFIPSQLQSQSCVPSTLSTVIGMLQGTPVDIQEDAAQEQWFSAGIGSGPYRNGGHAIHSSVLLEDGFALNCASVSHNPNIGSQIDQWVGEEERVVVLGVDYHALDPSQPPRSGHTMAIIGIEADDQGRTTDYLCIDVAQPEQIVLHPAERVLAAGRGAHMSFQGAIVPQQPVRWGIHEPGYQPATLEEQNAMLAELSNNNTEA